jgi:hypothetical protein
LIKKHEGIIYLEQHSKPICIASYFWEESMLKVNRLMWLVLILLVPLAAAQGQEKKITAEELVAAHLKSIGSPEAIKAIQSRIISGVAGVRFVQGASGAWNDGGFLVASEPQRMGLAMKFGALEYPGEYFAYDGKEVTVGNIKPGQKSPVAEFIYRNNGLVKEGLLGGELSLAWPLLNLKDRGAELKIAESKLDGKPVYEVEYRPKKVLGDLKIKLFFDTENFHHVRTEYKVSHKDDMSSARNVVSSAPLGSGYDNGQARPNATIMEGVPNSYYTMVEKFDNFQKAGDLTLPYSYSIEYEEQGQGSSFVANWNMRSSGQFLNNGKIDNDFFKAK